MEMLIGIIAMILWDAFKEPFLKWARKKTKTWWESKRNSEFFKFSDVWVIY